MPPDALVMTSTAGAEIAGRLARRGAGDGHSGSQAAFGRRFSR
jgi:hypothetical protein